MIEIQKKEDGVLFHITTENTSYLFRTLPTGHLEHLYYGARIASESYAPLFHNQSQPLGDVIAYTQETPNLNLEAMALEASSYGKGDIREPFVEVIHADGARTSDFVYVSYEKKAGHDRLNGLPASRVGEAEAQQLDILLEDRAYGLQLILTYGVFADADVITRSARLVNKSTETVRVERLLSVQLDFMQGAFDVTGFIGSWTDEMNKKRVPLDGGKLIFSSVCGASSNRANPFVMLSEKNATQERGEVYGFHLVYSGNHYECFEKTGLGLVRFSGGINPDGFSWQLAQGEQFQAPESLLCFSENGYNGLSIALSRYIRSHILAQEWRDKPRPILLNSWEAAYFDISESKLLRLARAGVDVGIELFVMDDGWFGRRDADNASLGDWQVNKKKLPGGIAGIAEKVAALGMDFGIWVEPEMVNEDSELYRAHPDWAMRIPGHAHAQGRNQMVLDLANEEVQAYLISFMEEILSCDKVRYVKWDMNRIFSDVYAPSLPAERQGECAHRYMLGLYTVMEHLTRNHPEVLFEGCASGGCRFDPGILYYFPQIWGSDDSDAVARAAIQESYSYGYPLSCVGAHVSDVPNHQTLRRTPLATRYAVAAFGSLGYECNIADMSAEERDQLREQILDYKIWRAVFAYGDFYRRDVENGYAWTVVSPDQKRAVHMEMQLLTKPHHPFSYFKLQGLDAQARYRVHYDPKQVDIRAFGSLVNTMAPVHIKKDGIMHNAIARFVKMDGDAVDFTASGALLMRAGFAAPMNFVGTGFDQNTRYMPDFAARLYYIEQVGGV